MTTYLPSGSFDSPAPAHNVCERVGFLSETTLEPLNLCDEHDFSASGMFRTMTSLVLYSIYATFCLYAYADLFLSCCTCSISMFPVIENLEMNDIFAIYRCFWRILVSTYLWTFLLRLKPRFLGVVIGFFNAPSLWHFKTLSKAIRR